MEATLKCRGIKEIYSDENSNPAAAAVHSSKLRPVLVSQSPSSSGLSLQSVSTNEDSQGQHHRNHGPALIRSDSRVSIVSDANSSYRESSKSRSATNSTHNGASLRGSLTDCDGVSAMLAASLGPQHSSGRNEVTDAGELPSFGSPAQTSCDNGAQMTHQEEGAHQQDEGGCESQQRVKPDEVKLSGLEPRGDLQLEFIQVGRAASSRGSRRNKFASFTAAKRARSNKDLQQVSKNPSGLKKKRSARGGGALEDDCGTFRLKRDKKRLVLSCDSPSASQQSALSKVDDGPEKLVERQVKRSYGSSTSDTDTYHSSGGMGELSPVSVLCPTSSNSSSMEPVAWTHFNMHVGTASTTQAEASGAAEGQRREVIFQDPEVQFLFKDPASCQDEQESQIRSLMTCMLHDISGPEEMDLLEAGTDSDSPNSAANHVPCHSINSVPPHELLDRSHDSGSMEGHMDARLSADFRPDLHIEDFDVEFLEMLQSDDPDDSDGTAPDSSPGYCPPHNSHAEFFQDGSLLQPHTDLYSSPELQPIGLDESGQGEADGSHVNALGGPLIATRSAAECQLDAPPSAAATAFQHQWAPPWSAIPDAVSSDPEHNGIRLVHLLLAGAEAVATSNMDLVTVILMRLKELSSRSGSTMQRVAAYFCDGLQCRVDQAGLFAKGGGASALVEIGRCDPVADMLGAFQILHEISPYIKFAHFTANQAILEAFENERRVHIIDYDIMEGMQWPSLMQALASRPEGPPHLRITALCRATSGSKRAPGSLISTVQETGRRLSEFAATLHIPFSFHQAKVDTENAQEFRPAVLKLVKGEVIAVNCMLHLPHMGSGGGGLQSARTTPGAVHAFFTAMHKLSPAVMTVVEEELSCCFPSHGGPGNFVTFFFEALHHYSAIFDSLEASLAPESTVRQMVERIFLAPRISSLVANFSSMGHSDAAMEEYFGESQNHQGTSLPQKCSQSLPSGLSEDGFETLSSCQIYNFSTEDVMRKNEGSTTSSSKHWSSLAFAGGFVPTQTSYRSQWQAKLLLSLFRDGYRLQQRDHRLVLGWRSFPLISASAWRCKH